MLTNVVLTEQRSMDRDVLLTNGLRAAAGFRAMGVSEGDVVAILMRNDFAFLECTHAANAIGAYAVPVNWHFKHDEVSHILVDCGAKILVAHADLLNAVRAAIPQGMPIIVVDTPPEARKDFKVDDAMASIAPDAVRYEAWRDGFAPWSEPAPATRASMIYTSGTTGKPKGVRRSPMTPDQMKQQRELFGKVYGVHPGMRAMIAGPLYHSSPNAFARQALGHAETIFLQSRFEPETTLADIEKHRITNLVMVPTMFVRLIKLPAEVRAKYDLSSVKCVTHTAAPCPEEVKRTMIDWWGPVINETYGGTEVGVAVACTSQEWLAHPGSVGRPIEFTQLRVYRDDGTEAEEGEAGEIYMRCSAYSEFAYNNLPDKRAAIERDGLISVGDIGFMQDGYLYLCDRKNDMVISGGVNIYPAEVESCLLQCPDVHDCAVFGVPDDDMGEHLMAAVQAVPGAKLDADGVRAYVAARLASYKVPRRVEFHDSLPREDSGKVFKRKLRDPYWEGRAARI